MCRQGMCRREQALLLGVLSGVMSQPAVIQMGDSWTELSATTLATFCKGATTVNRGVSSSTAAQWAASGTNNCPSPEMNRNCDFTNAFSAAYGTGYNRAVVTLGGNDFLEVEGCAEPYTTIQTKVTNAINALRAAAPAGIQIMLIGYCTPREAYAGCAGASNAAPSQALNQGIKAAADSMTDVTYVDAGDVCGAHGTTQWSPGQYHADAIHLNTKGYCKVWTLPAVQAWLGCEAATYNCDTPAKIADGHQTCSALTLANMGSCSGAYTIDVAPAGGSAATYSGSGAGGSSELWRIASGTDAGRWTCGASFSAAQTCSDTGAYCSNDVREQPDGTWYSVAYAASGDSTTAAPPDAFCTATAAFPPPPPSPPPPSPPVTSSPPSQPLGLLTANVAGYPTELHGGLCDVSDKNYGATPGQVRNPCDVYMDVPTACNKG